jgi:hypothetical protein
MFTCLPESSHIVPAVGRDTTTVSKTSPTIVMGHPKLRVLRENPPARLVLPTTNRARDKATQRVASS